MEPITFLIQLDYKTYIKASFLQYYLKWQIKGIYILFIYLLLVSLFSSDKNIVSTILTFVIAIAFTVILYFRVRNVYKSTPHAGQEMFWKIDETGIQIIGNSFSQHMGWDNISNITYSKKWIFIWYNKMQYSFFPRDKVSESQLYEIIRLTYSNRIKLQ
jgi:hypothetical protein